MNPFKRTLFLYFLYIHVKCFELKNFRCLITTRVHFIKLFTFIYKSTSALQATDFSIYTNIRGVTYTVNTANVMLLLCISHKINTIPNITKIYWFIALPWLSKFNLQKHDELLKNTAISVYNTSYAQFYYGTIFCKTSIQMQIQLTCSNHNQLRWEAYF